MKGAPRTVLSPAHVHLYTCDLDDGGAGVDVAVLADDERAHAARFRFPRDAGRYSRGRAFVRTVLAGYVGAPPDALRFVTNREGKPALHDAAARGVWFNLAHSAQHAVLAIAAHELVGVDVEVVRPGFADDEIAERFFAPSEVHALRALPAAEQPDAFFRCWTRKEAYIKARGGGLQIPLDSFTVEFAPGAPPALTWVDGAPAEPSQWTLLDISAATPGCVAALAVRARRTEIEAVHERSLTPR